MLPAHLHNGFEVGGGVRGVEWRYHGHPYQTETKVDRRQYESRLANKLANYVLARTSRHRTE
jgi:hypothetical protein